MAFVYSANFVSASLCELFWKCLNFYRRFGHEKSVVCWAFLGTHRRQEGVTYGIRASSTHDLGFATAFVDMSGFLMLIL